MTGRPVAVGILGIGALGEHLARSLLRRGHRVVTTVQGRSPATVARVAALGVEAAPGLRDVIAASDVLISLVPPAAAPGVIAELVAVGGADLGSRIVVDANSIAPATTRELAGQLAPTGARFVDASVMTLPRDVSPRMYVCGPAAADLLALDHPDWRVLPIGEDIGRASALKMCLSLVTKGTMGLWLAMLAAGELDGIQAELAEVLDLPHPLFPAETRALIARQAATGELSGRAVRWTGEMRECERAFAQIDIAAAFSAAAARTMQHLARIDASGPAAGRDDVSRLAELFRMDGD